MVRVYTVIFYTKDSPQKVSAQSVKKWLSYQGFKNLWVVVRESSNHISGGGGGGFQARTQVTSDRLIVRESVGLGQRGSDNKVLTWLLFHFILVPKVRLWTRLGMPIFLADQIICSRMGNLQTFCLLHNQCIFHFYRSHTD